MEEKIDQNFTRLWNFTEDVEKNMISSFEN